MSAVTPAVSPAEDAISWRMTHAEGASSEKEQVLQAKSSLLSALSSRGKRRLEHSEQKRKRIFLLASSSLFCSGAGDDMADVLR